MHFYHKLLTNILSNKYKYKSVNLRINGTMVTQIRTFFVIALMRSVSARRATNCDVYMRSLCKRPGSLILFFLFFFLLILVMPWVVFVRKTGAPLRIAYTTKPLKANALYPLFASILQTLLYNTHSACNTSYMCFHICAMRLQGTSLYTIECACVCVFQKSGYSFSHSLVFRHIAGGYRNALLPASHIYSARCVYYTPHKCFPGNTHTY